MYRPKYLKPIDQGALEMIAPEDRSEVINFLDEYGKDLKAALRKPHAIKNYKKII